MTYEEKQRAKALEIAKRTGKKVLDKLPKGWARLPTGNLTTAPQGYYWASNKKSFFDKDYKSALIKE